jgi:hypothetical protein
MSKWLYANDLFSLVKCGSRVLNKKLTTAPIYLEFIARSAIYYDVKQLYRCIRLHFNKAQSAAFIIDFECMPSPDFMLDDMVSLITKYGCVAESREERQTKRILNLKCLLCGVRDSRAHAYDDALDRPASLMAFLLLQCARNYDLPFLSEVFVDPGLRSLNGPFFEEKHRNLVMFSDLSKCLTYVFVPSFLMDRSEYKLKPSACGEFLSDLCIDFVAPDTNSRNISLEDDMACPSNQLLISRFHGSDGQRFIDNLSKTLVCLDLQSPGPRYNRFVCRYSELSPLLKVLALGISVTLIMDMPLRDTLETFEVVKMRDPESNFQLTSLPKSLRRILSTLIYQCDFKSDENWWHYWPERLALSRCTPRKLDTLISHFMPHIESEGCAFTLTDMILSNWRCIQAHRLLQPRHAPIAPLLVRGILGWKDSVLPLPLDADWLVGLTEPYLSEEDGLHSTRYTAPKPNWNVTEIELDLSQSAWMIDSDIMLHRMVKRLIAIFPNVHRVAVNSSRSDNALFNFAKHVDNNATDDLIMRYADMASFRGYINPELVEQTQLGVTSDDDVGSFDDEFEIRKGRKSRQARKRAKPLFNTKHNATDIAYWSDDASDDDWPIEMGGNDDDSQFTDASSDDNHFRDAYSDASLDDPRLDMESNDLMAWADRARAAYHEASPDERRLNGAHESDEELLMALRAENRKDGDEDTSGDDEMLLALRAASRKFINQQPSSGNEELPRPSRLRAAFREANPVESDEELPKPSRLHEAYREAESENVSKTDEDVPKLSRFRGAYLKGTHQGPNNDDVVGNEASSSGSDESIDLDGLEDMSSASDYSFVRDDTTTPPRQRPRYYPDEPYDSDDAATHRSWDGTSSMMQSFFMSGLLHHTLPTSNDKDSNPKGSKKTSQSAAYRQDALFADRRSKKPGRQRNLKDEMIFFLNRYLCKLPNLESLFCLSSSSNDVLRHLHLTKMGSSLKRLDLCNVRLHPTLLKRIQSMHLTTLNISVSNESTPAGANADFMALVKSLPPTLLHLRIVRSKPVDFNGCFFQLANWLPPKLHFLSMEAFTVTRTQFLPLVHMFCGMHSRRFLSMVLLTRLMNKQILKEVVIPFYYATLVPL